MLLYVTVSPKDASVGIMESARAMLSAATVPEAEDARLPLCAPGLSAGHETVSRPEYCPVGAERESKGTSFLLPRSIAAAQRICHSIYSIARYFSLGEVLIIKKKHGRKKTIVKKTEIRE